MVTRRTVTLALAAAAVGPAMGAAPRAREVRVPTRGFALPGWIAAEPHVPSSAWLETLRARGFETVRLPVDPRYAGVDMLHQVSIAIATLADLGYDTIVDLHCGDAPAPEIEQAWRELAPLVADTNPGSVFVELLNEPAFETDEWLSLRDGLAEAVRSRAPQHTMIWGPARYQGVWELDNEPPLDDPNSIAAVHFYWPMAFTHQCENWMASALSRFRDLPFPATRNTQAVATLARRLDDTDRRVLDEAFTEPWTTLAIADGMARAADWSRRTGVPVQLGEFGVLNFCVDPVSRATWTGALRRAAETHGIGWVYWEADQGFGFAVDRAAPAGLDDTIIAALLA